MADAEPKATSVTPPEEPRPKPKRPRGRPIALESELEEFFTQLGAGVMILNQFDGLVVIQQAHENAAALAKLANKNAKVKKALEALTNVSSMGAVVGVIGGTAVPILMNHGVLPPGMPMSGEWLEPPIRKQFREEVERQRQEASSDAPGDAPDTPGPITH
jgi:hypothetical protein